MSRIIQFAGLSMTGLLAGNELGTLIGSHPGLRALPLPAQIQAEQALTGRLVKIMPFYTSATLAAVVAAAVDRAGRPGFGLSVVAVGATASMLAITAVGNIPLNRATAAYPVSGDAPEWEAIRRRWERLHTARVALDLAAFAALAVAALGPGRRPR